MKKFILIILIIVFAATMSFVGISCKTTTETTTAETTTTAAETTKAAEETTTTKAGEVGEPSQPIKIVVWDWQAGTKAYDDALNEINGKYHELHPNVTVERTAYNLSEYSELIKTAVQSNTLPDLFGLYQGTMEREVEKTGILHTFDADINADQEWKANLGKTIELGGIKSADNKIIQIPYDIFYLSGIGYKNVLENMKSSVDEVKSLKSYKELGDLCQKFKEAGYKTWYLEAGLAGAYLLRERFYVWSYSVAKDVNVIYDAEFGKRSWTEEPFVKAAEAVKETARMMREDVQALDAQTDTYALLKNQECWGGWYEGPWSVGILLDNKTDIDNAFYFFLPPVAENALPNCWAADAGQVLAMREDNPNKDQVIKYLKYLATPEVSAIFIKNLIHPAGKFPDNWKDIAGYPVYIEGVEMYQNSNVAPWICYTPEVETALLDNISLIYKGELSPMDGLKKIDEATKAYWASKK
ncbi:MAG: ABC transporter substrate-binding protein [Actinobacteria bacterium]|nr:ABC transporter substrate-binding protein [Actinomycetota bacterium]